MNSEQNIMSDHELIEKAAALDLLGKCAQRYNCTIIPPQEGGFRVESWDGLIVGDEAETLALAITLFAKKLLTKP